MLRYLCEVSTNRRAPCCEMKYKLDGDFRAIFWPSFCQIINQKSVTSLVQKTKQSVIIIDGHDRYHWVCLPSYQLNRLYYKVRQVLYLESATEQSCASGSNVMFVISFNPRHRWLSLHHRY